MSLIVIPFCLSVCRSFFRYLQPTTIDRSQPNLVYTCPRTRVSLFGSPISHTFGARGKICKISPISNAYSCHCERDASCRMTCLSVCLQVCPWSALEHISRIARPNFNILRTFPVVVARSPSGSVATRYMNFRFGEGRHVMMFSYYSPNVGVFLPQQRHCSIVHW